MFKRFTVDENVSNVSKVKTSVQRKICQKLAEQFPLLDANDGALMEQLLPKKAPLLVAKCTGTEHLQIVVSEDGIPLFFNMRDGPFLPTLKLLHKLPTLMKIVRADKGAIPYVLSGANIMAPGLTSKGGDMPEEIASGEAVAIMAEGKELATAVGIMQMSTSEM
jgi:PUA domain protein